MKNKIDTAQGAAEYTMGIKFQMKLVIDEDFIREVSKKSSRICGNILAGAGILASFWAVYLLVSKTAGNAGIWILAAGILLLLLGITAQSWLPKTSLFILKLRKEDGTHKVTVYETEFLIYSEQYQTCRTLSLKDMKRWEKEGPIYKIWLPGKVFAFRETDFLSGNAAAFEVFLGSAERKSI